MKNYNTFNDEEDLQEGESVNNKIFGWLFVIVLLSILCIGVYFLTKNIN